MVVEVKEEVGWGQRGVSRTETEPMKLAEETDEAKEFCQGGAAGRPSHQQVVQPDTHSLRKTLNMLGKH